MSKTWQSSRRTLFTLAALGGVAACGHGTPAPAPTPSEPPGGELLHAYKLPAAKATGNLAWSPKGDLLAVPGTGLITLLNVATTGTTVLQGQSVRKVIDVTWAADGKRLASLDDNGTVHLWALDTGTGPTQALPDAANLFVRWSPRGDLLAAGDLGGVHLFDMTGGAPRHILDLIPPDPKRLNYTEAFAWTPDGTACYLAWIDYVLRYHVPDGKPTARWDQTGDKGVASALAVAADGRLAVGGVFGDGPDVRIFSADLNNLGSLLPMPPYVHDHMVVGWSSDGRQLGAVDRGGRRACIWTVHGTSGVLAAWLNKPIDVADGVIGIAWQPGTDVLATVSEFGSVGLWRARS